MQVIISNNARLLLKQRKSVILKHFWKNANMNQKKKMEKLTDDDLEPSSSDESYNDSHDETESDNEKDNDEPNE